MAWYNSLWTYRFKVTIDHTKVSSDESDFPVLITEANCPAAFWTHVKSDGTDIVVTQSDGTTKLKRELASITVGTPLMELWTKVTSLSSSSDTEIYVYYGYASAAESNDTDTWDVNYKAVWHMDNTSFSDSSSNSHDLTQSGTVNTRAGKVGQGADLTASTSQYLSHADHNDFDNGQKFTWEWWVKFDAVPGIDGMVSKRTGSGQTNYPYAFFLYTASKLFFDIYANNNRWDDGHAKGTDTWYHIVITFDGALSSASRVKYYRDGGNSQTHTETGNVVPDVNAPLFIGILNSGYANALDGCMDEVRISKGIARTAEWFSTEYASYNAPSTFYSCGGEETETVAWTDLIHGIANASVAKIHGVAKASIAKVLNG